MMVAATGAQMKAIDAETINDLGIPGIVLMETCRNCCHGSD